MIKNKAQHLQQLRLHPKLTCPRKTSSSDKPPGPRHPLLKVKNNSKELSAPRPPTVVVKEEDAEAVAVEVVEGVSL